MLKRLLSAMKIKTVPLDRVTGVYRKDSLDNNNVIALLGF